MIKNNVNLKISLRNEKGVKLFRTRESLHKPMVMIDD